MTKSNCPSCRAQDKQYPGQGNGTCKGPVTKGNGVHVQDFQDVKDVQATAQREGRELNNVTR